MKKKVFCKLIVLYSLTCFQHALAQTPAPKEPSQIEASPARQDDSGFDNKKSLADLMYMTKKGDRTINLGFYASDLNFGYYSSTDATHLADQTVRASGSKIKVYYGLIEDLYIALATGYLFEKSTEQIIGTWAGYINGQRTMVTSEGMEEFTGEVKWRPVQQEVGLVNVNVGISYSPKSSDKKKASASEKGDAGRGADLTEMVLQVGNKFKYFSYSVEINYSQIGTRLIRDSLGATDEIAGGNQTTATLNLQTTPNKRLALNLGVARIALTQTISTPNTGWPTTENGSNGYAIYARTQVDVLPDRLSVALDYSKTIIEAHTYSISSTTYKVDDLVTNQYGVRLITRF